MIIPSAVLVGLLTLSEWQGLVEPEPIRLVWDDLADCETGEWINGGEDFQEGSARWNAKDGSFQGGLQFHPNTWSAYREDSDPDKAYWADRETQIRVAVHVLEEQGWKAWPTCSRLLGLRE